jgi:hypothetical protein
LPQDTTPVIKETVIGFETQIEALFRQGKRAPEIGQMLGINERAVLAYALEGESKTYSEASEQAHIYFRPRPTTTEETKQPQLTQTLPKPQHFLYSCQYHTNKLHRVNLLTGKKSCHEVPDYHFEWHCRWSELPGGSLLITGGRGRDVVVDDGTFAVSHQPPMHTARSNHAALYHSQYVYVLRGSGRRECKRYSCAESRWEVLPALPVAGKGMSAVEVENSLLLLEATLLAKA